jgi:hypothetical protein
MDDHFQRMLSSAQRTKKNDAVSMPVDSSVATSGAGAGFKRKREAEDDDDIERFYERERGKRVAPEDGNLDQATIQRMLDEADKLEMVALDEPGMKKLLLNLEKKINKNQLLRAKFPEVPAKFMESEIELDDHIKELSILATVPSFYPILVDLGVTESLLGLVAHENTDVSISTLDLLNTMSDPDVLSEDIENTKIFVSSLVSFSPTLVLATWRKDAHYRYFYSASSSPASTYMYMYAYISI